MDPELPFRAEHGYDALYGLEILTATDGQLTGRVAVHDQLKQLAALHEQGALTDDEFTTAKARLLGG